ncbi:MAG: hypothetical protein J1F11_02385 [Oscillospiraceae bacterium]|nr:hypothetical protein [Oscillospiraceae bacterium]
MKKPVFIICTVYAVIVCYIASYFYTESLAYIPPANPRQDISAVTEKSPSELTEEDYRFIFEQTGLGKAAVSGLPDLTLLYDYQDSYYAPAEYKCIRNSPISFEERVTGKPIKLAPLEEGDILVTSCAHVLSWRNGHAAIVVDSDRGTTLEAVVIGKNSKTQDISKWERYPNFAVLRLKDTDKKERAEIARFAMDDLYNIPYNVFIGLYPMKYSSPGNVTGTQCAHLIWIAYAAYGYDIDSSRGLIVTPRDILNSDRFEIVQIYGMG